MTPPATSRRCDTRRLLAAAAFALVTSGGVVMAAMSAPQQAIHDGYAAAAKAADPAFSAFSAERGKALFQGKHTGGKAATPSCTSCHTDDPRKSGQTRAGKAIEPMAGSVNPKRYTNRDDVEKWYGRNCSDVLGRACTPLEKGDVMAYLLGL